MRTTRGAATLLITVLTAVAPTFAADDPESLAKRLDAMREQLKVPGAVIGVWRPNAEPLKLALGVADAEKQAPMPLDAAFRIASLSKVFVGQVVLQLAGEGKLSIDDPISKYVEGVPAGDKVTLRHLGNHRSGLFNHIESREVKDAFAADPSRRWTEDELLGFCFKNPAYFVPGEEHHYSNGNTVLLAKVIERVTGNPWPREVENRILKPLEMRSTLIPIDNRLPSPHAKGYALGDESGPFFHRGDKRFDVTETSPTWWGPAGSMISTLDDLHRAAKPLAQGELLSEPMREELHRWTAADQGGFEYGFHIERVRGAIGHDGDVPGFQTIMLYFPEKDATIVVLTNLYGWSVRNMPADRMAWLIAEELLDVPAKP